MIGGTTPAARNVVSGNVGTGSRCGMRVVRGTVGTDHRHGRGAEQRIRRDAVQSSAPSSAASRLALATCCRAPRPTAAAASKRTTRPTHRSWATARHRRGRRPAAARTSARRCSTSSPPTTSSAGQRLAGNVIAYNNGYGVASRQPAAGRSNTIRANRIHDNDDGGIGLFAGANDDLASHDIRHDPPHHSHSAPSRSSPTATAGRRIEGAVCQPDGTRRGDEAGRPTSPRPTPTSATTPRCSRHRSFLADADRQSDADDPTATATADTEPHGLGDAPSDGDRTTTSSRRPRRRAPDRDATRPRRPPRRRRRHGTGVGDPSAVPHSVEDQHRDRPATRRARHRRRPPRPRRRRIHRPVAATHAERDGDRFDGRIPSRPPYHPAPRPHRPPRLARHAAASRPHPRRPPSRRHPLP